MKKTIILIGIISLLSIPKVAMAKESEVTERFNVISQQEKYYKTITSSNNQYNTSKKSSTIEISKEEYEAFNVAENQARGNGQSETTYKKLTTSILSNGSRYRYKTELQWKNFPEVRSYDVIGIGHYSNVIYYSSLNFNQTYCLTDGTCRTLTTYYPKTTSTGVGAAFKIPTGNLSKLTQTLYFDVVKNTNGTISSQAAYGDYSHATENVTTTQAQNYSIGTSGITFSSGVSNMYDSMPSAVATWNGTW